ncbi:polyamine ABC transporter substrate-binding protein [Nitratireductor sp. L1-7-SE]|uniref:Polyamine ABC transporter substrate-binding protein n=1 Tax=Nitratireductor rhodophyticola TaxID=2854036 RepID=A0ABS7RBK9_9HYPH|nr:ABC transporter substrate-binding protein [Nitratireductor rhodophyticola]MBY8918327.1 polyamine ABC transporter substrate-binding protein [Nitratireductor rhodophyticola]MBY8920864.1 polyamine ABC transporter substrate-binding protein [Nitratireductor rhodophyticola]
MKRTIATTLISLLMAGSALAAGETLNIGMGSADAGKLDPHVATSTPDKGLLHWMFNGLVRIKPGEASPADIEPDIAESWTASDDGLTWTFKLREDVECHGDYGPLDAEDVVYSLNRSANSDVSAFAKDYSAFDSVEATGDHEVTIKLKNPVPSLLGMLVPYHGGNIVCKDAVEALGADFERTPIGTGPFMFEEYQPQQYVKLVANPEYFRGEPKIKEIYYRYIPSDASRDLAFQSGEIDMIYGKQDQTWVERISKIPGTKVAVMKPGEMSVIHLNMTMPPLDDVRVRRAVAHAINRDAMVQFKGPDVTLAAISPVPEGYLGFTDDVPTYEYSIEKAKALLAEAGHPDGVTIKAIHTTLPGMITTMEAIQALLREADINLEIETVEHATFHEQIRKDLSQVTHYAAARFPVADTYLSQFFHSDAIVGTPTAVTNFSHCAVADDEITAARVETDADRQLELWAEAQRKIMDEVCAVPIVQSLQLWAWKDTLDLGVEVNGSLNLSPPVTEAAHFTE